ncbi:hypothetical protein C8F04DRAFT_1177869 [Mycena alexandri]|uniref:Uncharacterized protein n=1 Tax=Mycena alexandri TaxID=1745969 RepID=A0AAD6T8R9_9AGAR|nr:hypothetical protein C8F04DRAFT_1177869 [Mycena alexandri]
MGSDRLTIDHHHDSPLSVDRSVWPVELAGNKARGQRCLWWGNFPDPRTGIKTRKWLNTGLTRLLGHHFTPIIAIHPPASLTASTLAPNARWLTLPQVSITQRDFQSTQKLQAGFPCVGEFFIAKALDGANSPQNSFNDPRAPSRAHKALQAPAPLLSAAQNSRGQCPASLSCFFTSPRVHVGLEMVEDLHTPLLPTHPHARALFPKCASPSGIPARCTHPAPPTPDVLETDGIEVPECEPLVHFDGVSDSLDLSLSTSLSTAHPRDLHRSRSPTLPPSNSRSTPDALRAAVVPNPARPPPTRL